MKYLTVEIRSAPRWTDIYALQDGAYVHSLHKAPTPLRTLLWAGSPTAIVPEDWSGHFQLVACAWCGFDIELQAASHPGAMVSHGICLPCTSSISFSEA